MNTTLQKLQDQVIVITGATSGIGLVTARQAAQRGARLVLAARSESALRQLMREITDMGGSAVYVAADVGRQDDVRQIARVATETYGSFDTWVNNAGVSIYGQLEDVPIVDMRQLFETNFWGVVHGSLEAAAHLKQRGGAIINIGSVLSERAILLQGIYSASKHAVKGFTDALRMELERDRAPVSVTLIKPSAINTPYAKHAKNFMEHDTDLPPPVYAPDLVAQAILHAAEHSERELFVGSGGASLAVMGNLAPRLTDKVMAMVFAGQQQSDLPVRSREDNGLDHAASTLEERGEFRGHTIESSPYTQAEMHPVVAGAVVAGASAVAAIAWRVSRNDGRRR